MSILINETIDLYDIKWDNFSHVLSRHGKVNQELLLMQASVSISYSLYAEKNKLNLWRFSKHDMNKLYQKLAKLEKELVAAKSQEEKDQIEDEIDEIQDEIEQLENDKYGNDDVDDY